jgi:putative transposase
MKTPKALYHRPRFPGTVISCAVRWYFRFQFSLRDIEELLLERGVVVSYETIRRWCDKFGKQCVKRAQPVPGSPWHLDEVFINGGGEPYLPWRAVDQHGAEFDILLQKRGDTAAAKRFFQQLVAQYPNGPRKIITESCAAIQPRKPRYRTSPASPEIRLPYSEYRSPAHSLLPPR